MISTEPIWWESRAPECPRVPRRGLRADVAIIGGGFTGLSVAYHLLGRRPGSRVVVLEAERVGAGASGRTTGLLGPGVGQSLVALVRRHGPARAHALYAATLRAVGTVRDLVGAEGIECDLEMTGQLIVGRSRGGRARIGALGALLGELEFPVEILDSDALDRALRFAPSARVADGGPAALRLPVAGTLHPLRLLNGLADRVIRRGGAIFENARVTQILDGAPVSVGVKEGGAILADEVVVATAGYTPSLGLLRERLLPVHLQVVATEPLDAQARETLGWKGREGVLDSRRIFNYFRLTADDRIVFGGGAPRYEWAGGPEHPRHSARALDGLVRELAATFHPDARLRVARGWTGVIGYTFDALPAIHRLRGRPSVLHVVGWCGHGVALSVASGPWVAQMLCDGAVPEDLPWYRDDPPRLPFEPVRWLGFRTSVGMMSLLDRIA